MKTIERRTKIFITENCFDLLFHISSKCEKSFKKHVYLKNQLKFLNIKAIHNSLDLYFFIVSPIIIMAFIMRSMRIQRLQTQYNNDALTPFVFFLFFFMFLFLLSFQSFHSFFFMLKFFVIINIVVSVIYFIYYYLFNH